MIAFAGWTLPVQYKAQSHIQSHTWTRENASLFDVSHMLQTRIEGDDRLAFMESLCPSDLQALPEGQATYSLLTNERGGIVDDCIITKHADHLYLVVNAACADKDLAHLRSHINRYNITLAPYTDKALLALQGPKAASVLESLLNKPLDQMGFMEARFVELGGMPVHVSRSGYTGEDGFEISVDADKSTLLAEKLLDHADVMWAGLAARDSLRLEAGLCLYGHDLNDDTTPVEANLNWTIAKRRRESGEFLGSSVILQQLQQGVSRKRVGFVVQGAPAREGAPLFHEGQVGSITSGCPSPSLGVNIAMGYVDKSLSKLKTKVEVQVRNRMQPAVVSKMPFIPSRYHKP
jgi:aminomethyltransferase